MWVCLCSFILEVSVLRRISKRRVFENSITKISLIYYVHHFFCFFPLRRRNIQTGSLYSFIARRILSHGWIYIHTYFLYDTIRERMHRLIDKNCHYFYVRGKIRILCGISFFNPFFGILRLLLFFKCHFFFGHSTNTPAFYDTRCIPCFTTRKKLFPLLVFHFI